MNFLLYLIPLVVFLIASFTMYGISTEEDKNTFSSIFIKNVLPASVISVLVFVIIKFKDSSVFNSEPMMRGNYFD